MNTSSILPFSRRNILRVVVILAIGYVLTATAINLWAQGFTNDAVVDGFATGLTNQQQDGDEALRSDNREIAFTGSRGTYSGMLYGFAPDDNPVALTSVGSVSADTSAIPAAGVRATTSRAGRAAKPQFVTGLSGRGFYSHP